MKFRQIYYRCIRLREITKFISYVTNLSLEEERKKELEFEVGSDWRGEIKNAS